MKKKRFTYTHVALGCGCRFTDEHSQTLVFLVIHSTTAKIEKRKKPPLHYVETFILNKINMYEMNESTVGAIFSLCLSYESI